MVCDGKQAAVLAGYEHKNIPAACANFRHHQITYLSFCLFRISAFDGRQIAGQARELVFWNIPDGLRIPTQGGQVFRSDPGHCSDLMAATIPI